MEDAAARRERLRGIRNIVEGTRELEGQSHAANLEGDRHPESADAEAEAEEEEEEPAVRFRTYVPRDADLHQLKRPLQPAPKFEDPVVVNPADAPTAGNEPMAAIAPKKPNWDLRRDVAKKMEKLERRTQRSMIELMHEEVARREAEEKAQGVVEDAPRGEAAAA